MEGIAYVWELLNLQSEKNQQSLPQHQHNLQRQLPDDAFITTTADRKDSATMEYVPLVNNVISTVMQLMASVQRNVLHYVMISRYQ